MSGMAIRHSSAMKGAFSGAAAANSALTWQNTWGDNTKIYIRTLTCLSTDVLHVIVEAQIPL